MNKFRRVKGDTENNFEGVDKMIQELREISWSVLGKLDEEGVRGTCIWDQGDREARVWAIGHWYVHHRPIGRWPIHPTDRSELPVFSGTVRMDPYEADYQSYRYSLVVEVHPNPAEGKSPATHTIQSPRPTGLIRHLCRPVGLADCRLPEAGQPNVT